MCCVWQYGWRGRPCVQLSGDCDLAPITSLLSSLFTICFQRPAASRPIMDESRPQYGEVLATFDFDGHLRKLEEEANTPEGKRKREQTQRFYQQERAIWDQVYAENPGQDVLKHREKVDRILIKKNIGTPEDLAALSKKHLDSAANDLGKLLGPEPSLASRFTCQEVATHTTEQLQAMANDRDAALADRRRTATKRRLIANQDAQNCSSEEPRWPVSTTHTKQRPKLEHLRLICPTTIDICEHQWLHIRRQLNPQRVWSFHSAAVATATASSFKPASMASLSEAITTSQVVSRLLEAPSHSHLKMSLRTIPFVTDPAFGRKSKAGYEKARVKRWSVQHNHLRLALAAISSI